ncbi:monocarboxylate transporter 12-like [Gigantopelta aegis]|uniref:monocarboxylate transporter 12-like n=1 Tax=Gigantopelta aegis TaxID=1735272 RepID=UPI001B88E56E|nr:monocarboxylate transporter 12-like [Gigantopelta aegis]XP_041368832.1 monocarboxylate transporter 12-like [Gigantopelta aegis]XP_041368833.1 monocarboxylate transporter 12-like [Gigantopelta aegis]
MEQTKSAGDVSVDGDDDDDDVVDDAGHHDDVGSDTEMVKDSNQLSNAAACFDESGDEKCDADLELELVTPPVAPDGGYGWIIVLGASLAHLIIGGLERSDGVLFLKFINKFNQSAQATAWVASLCSSVRLVLGPFASYFSNRFSCRAAVITGSVISALGVLLSGFTTQLVQLYFTYGVISGIGRSLAYAPCLIITGMYFDKRRGLAVGMATAGVGAGTFLIPPAVEFIFEEYDYLGAFVILSGLCLNLAVCGVLMRPLSLHRRILELKRKNKTRVIFSEGKSYFHTVVASNNTDNAISGSGSSKSIKDENRIPLNVQDHATDAKSLIAKENLTGAVKKTEGISKTETKKKQRFIELTLLKEPRFLIFCFSILLFTASFKAGFTFLPALVKSSGLSESNAALILSIAGVLDTIGRVLVGFLFDFPKVKKFRSLIYNLIVFAVAAVSFVCPLVKSFEGFAILVAVYGFLTGSYISQKTLIIVDILGVEKLSSSFGILICFQGVGSLFGPPLSGLMKDIYGQYDEAFYFCGGLMVLSGLIMLGPTIWQRIHP